MKKINQIDFTPGLISLKRNLVSKLKLKPIKNDVKHWQINEKLKASIYFQLGYDIQRKYHL